MSEDEVVESIVSVLAEIRAEPVENLVSEVEDAVMVTSQEVVAILVTLESAIGIDTSDPEVLKGCDLQSLQQLVDFVAAAAVGR